MFGLGKKSYEDRLEKTDSEIQKAQSTLISKQTQKRGVIEEIQVDLKTTVELGKQALTDIKNSSEITVQAIKDKAQSDIQEVLVGAKTAEVAVKEGTDSRVKYLEGILKNI